MAPGNGEIARDKGKRIDFKDTGNAHSGLLRVTVQMWPSGLPPPNTSCEKGQRSTQNPDPSPQSKKSLQLFQHLKYLFNKTTKSHPHRTIVKQYSQLVIIVIYNTKQFPQKSEKHQT
jgi:hypothetical protein